MPSQMRGFAAVLVPARAEMAVVEPEHLRRQPRGHVHAVGDVADRNFVFGLPGYKPGPHGARDFAVQRRDRIGAARKLQAQHRHAELPHRDVARVFAAERHEPFVRNAERVAQRSEVLFDQVGAEAVVSRRDGVWVVKTTSRLTSGTA